MEMPNVNHTADTIFFEDLTVAKVCSITPSDNFGFGVSSYILGVFSATQSYDDFFSEIESNKDNYSILSKFKTKTLLGYIQSINSRLDSISDSIIIVQPTYDNSIQYTFSVGETNYYLEQFVNYKEDELDECVLTGISGKKIVFSFAGNLDDALFTLESELKSFIEPNIETFDASTLSEDFITKRELSFI